MHIKHVGREVPFKVIRSYNLYWAVDDAGVCLFRVGTKAGDEIKLFDKYELCDEEGNSIDV